MCCGLFWYICVILYYDEMKIDMKSNVLNCMTGRRFLVVILLCCISFGIRGQSNVEYYENGNKKYKETIRNEHYINKRIWWTVDGEIKSIAYYTREGVLKKYKNWDEEGKLVQNDNYKKEQKRKGKTDLSLIKWEEAEDGIGFYFENEGEGACPLILDTVVIHFIGYFENGEQFDNSYDNGNMLEIAIGVDIYLESFMNSIAMFKEKQKGYIKIPSELAYGDMPVGNIPANSTLIYFVEIVEIKRI